MEQKKQISCDQKLPPLSSRHQWFIAQDLESNTQIFYTIDNPQYHYSCRVNELHGRRARAYFHGWVVLSSHPDNVLWSLWNPLTSELIHLPLLIHEEKHLYECCLSAPPNDQGSVLLLTSTKVPTIVYCRLDCERNRLKWTEMSYAKQFYIYDVGDCLLVSPTCCNGKVYAMSMEPFYTFVIQVDIVVRGKEVVISLLPFVEVPHSNYYACPLHYNFRNMYSFLKGSCEELFYIEAGYKDEARKMFCDVFLFKLDMPSMIWKQIVDLKDAIFFLELASDYPACYYGSAVNSEVGGYVHMLGESGKIIYSFHAVDRTMSISSMPCIVLESQASAWAMLEWRLEVDHAIEEEDKDAIEEEDKDTQIVARRVKGDKTEFDIATGESRLLNIPIDILKMIMELCVGIEYMRFRATCKHCRLAAPPIQWNNKTSLTRLQRYSLASPWLMVLDNYRGIITFIDPICGERYFIKIPQELKGDYRINYSRYGWLLMSKIEGPMVFFNPFTSNIRELPQMEMVPYVGSFCFSAPPTSPECMVVGFTTSGVYIRFVSLVSTWREIRLDFGGGDPYSYHFPTFINGDVYAVRSNNKGLYAFRDMTEDGHSSLEVVLDKAPISGCKSPTKYFLSSCDHHLFLVIVGEFGESVEVFKANESTDEWEKIDGLGKLMIYISDISCICLEAKSPEMRNKIYFPRLLHDGKTKIVFYSLETRRYHTSDDKIIQESFGANFLGTKHHCNPHTWIEPSWS